MVTYHAKHVSSTGREFKADYNPAKSFLRCKKLIWTYILAYFSQDKINSVFYRKYLRFVIKTFIWSMMLYVVSLTPFIMSTVSMSQVLNLFVFLLISLILSWLNYHESQLFLLLVGIFIVSSGALLLSQFIGLIINLFLFTGTLFYFCRMKIQVEKFLSHSQLLYQLEQSYLR